MPIHEATRAPDAAERFAALDNKVQTHCRRAPPTWPAALLAGLAVRRLL